MFGLILSVQARGSSPPSGPTRVAWIVTRDGAELFVNSRSTLWKTLFRICFIFAITELCTSIASDVLDKGHIYPGNKP